jgi:methylenetetrahydrofolate reductase (NADPH)
LSASRSVAIRRRSAREELADPDPGPMESQRRHPRSFSFEFFPPKTPEGVERLRLTRQQLQQLGPKFFSVTYGAGGSTRDRTLEAVLEIRDAGFAAAPHLSCIGSTRADIAATLDLYRSKGIRHIVALRGDLPSGAASAGELRYANELVEFIRATTGDWFQIEVACYPEYHPQARSPGEDLENFRRKVDAGADAAITQYFYNADAYFRFVDQCEAHAVTIPIVPGIMPIANFSQLARFSDACGAEIPRWIRLKLASFGDDSASIRSFGLDVVTDLCDRLLAAGAPGLHFYTMNQAGLTTTLWQRLGL